MSLFVSAAPTTSRRRSRPAVRRLSAAGIVLGALGLLAACVTPGYGNYSPSAGRPATTAETASISTAVHGSPLTAKAAPRTFSVTGVRISRLTPTYAFATIDPTSPQLDGAAVALRRASTTASTWTVTQVGSAQVGCSVAPAQVRAEFGLAC